MISFVQDPVFKSVSHFFFHLLSIINRVPLILITLSTKATSFFNYQSISLKDVPSD